jgi:hypothetical protein
MGESGWSRERKEPQKMVYSIEELKNDLKLPQSTLSRLDCGNPTCGWRQDGKKWVHIRHNISDSAPAWLLRFKGLCRRPDGEEVWISDTTGSVSGCDARIQP